MAVAVVGSLHLDVVVDAPRLPALDETLVGQSVAYAFGGKGGNQAVAAARMGAEVAMVGRVGSDDFAARLLADLDAAGVDRKGVQQDDGASGMSVAIVDAAGEYGAVIVSAANLRIEVDPLELAENTSVLILQNEVPEGVNLRAAQRARALGARVILNAAPAREVCAVLMALIDILVVNRGEAEMLGGTGTPADQAAALCNCGCRAVVVTLGADGLVWAAGGKATALSAFAVDVVSTHGAGDAFVGALATELDRGAEFPAALMRAQAAAGLHVSTPVDQRPAITSQKVSVFAQTSRP